MAYDILKIQNIIKAHNVPYSTFGISEKTVKKWANGTSVPREDTIKKIADYFSIPLKELWAAENIQTNSPSDKIGHVNSSSIFESNFLFLKEFDSELYLKGSTAEQHFISGIHNPEIYNDCINNINFVAKRIINILLQDMASPPPYGYNQYEKIMYLKESGEINEEEYRILNEIRESRNLREHRSAKYTRAQTLLLLKKCWKICCFLATRYDINCPQHFNPPHYTDTQYIKSDKLSPKQKQKEAISNSNYNDIVIYSMIVRDGHTVDKYRSFSTKHIQDLAELFLCIRRKRAVPSLENFSYTKHRSTLIEHYPIDIIEELDSLFLPEYRAALNDLVGKISEIAGEIK